VESASMIEAFGRAIVLRRPSGDVPCKSQSGDASVTRHFCSVEAALGCEFPVTRNLA
jgi:hypothetical protein